MNEVKLYRYTVKTNHGEIIIVGTDEADARLMAEKAGYITYSAEKIEDKKQAESTCDYISWCEEMEFTPC